jgi:hypothetical protein
LDSENIGADVCQTGNIEREYWKNEYRENIGTTWTIEETIGALI